MVNFTSISRIKSYITRGRGDLLYTYEDSEKGGKTKDWIDEGNTFKAKVSLRSQTYSNAQCVTADFKANKNSNFLSWRRLGLIDERAYDSKSNICRTMET